MPVGQVIRSHSNIYYVLVDDREVECRPRGKFRLDKITVLAGDLVEVQLEPNGEGRIDKVLERKTVLQRPAVANVDQALVVYTIREPEADYPFLDRVLIHAEQAGVDVLILLNKIDLLSEEEIDSFVRTYRDQAGYTVLPLAAKPEINLDALPPYLRGKVSVLAGHSGVGKSRLVRALEPARDDIKVGALSSKMGRGKHTTRHVELIRLTAGGLIVDSPGFTYLEFQAMEKWDLRRYFPEFRQAAAACRYEDCLHRKEPECGVRDAVAEGAITRSRYDNYLFFLGEVEALKRW